MARRKGPSKRKARAREEEPEVEEEEVYEEDDGGPESKPNETSQLLTALLIVAFAFIFVGILLTWHHLHKHYDTPFMMVMKKQPSEMVKAVAAKDFGGPVDEDEAEGEDEGDEGDESDEDGDEGESEEEE